MSEACSKSRIDVLVQMNQTQLKTLALAQITMM